MNKATKLINENKEKFEIYFNYLVNENKKYNLTSITEEKEVYVKHFEDSVILGDYFDLTKEVSLCDIGSGAGFPAIPLKICYPNIKVTIVEPTSKRALFMKNLIEKLSLKDIEVVNARSEDIARDYTNNFDFVCARAVAQLPTLLELLIRFTKVGGNVIAYKGDKGKEEVLMATNAMKILGCKLDKIIEYELKDNMGKRSLVVINKTKETSEKYPRKYQEIKRKPL